MTDRRTVLITGGTGTLGFHTAQAILAAGGWNVLITGRTEERVAEAVARLGEQASGHPLNLDSLADVPPYVRSLPPLDALICNAGVMNVSGTQLTDDGIEQTFGVNHLAHFLLVREALPKLVTPARIVFISSTTHDPTKRTGFPPATYASARELAHPGDTNEDPFRVGRRRYTTSKLCNVVAAYEFARRIPPDIATFNAYDPGQTPGTGLARDHPPFRGFVWHHVMPLLAYVPGIRMVSAKRAGAGLARMVLDPSLAGTTGAYISGTQEIRSSVDSYDAKIAEDLWNTSVELTAGYSTS